MRRIKTRVRTIFPRIFNARDIQFQWQGLKDEYRIHQAFEHSKVDAVKGDTVRFFNEICHLKTFTYQLELAEL